MKAVLIPSAVFMPREMRKQFGELPTGLFPLNGKPMIFHLYERYKNIVDLVYVVVFEGDYLVEKYIVSQKLPINIIKLDKLQDLGYTVAYGLEKIVENNKVDHIYINYADSLLDDDILVHKDKNVVYYSKCEWDSVWSYFCIKNGSISTVIDKSLAGKPNKVKNIGNVFIGAFGIDDPRALLSYLKDMLEKPVKEIDSFYLALQNYTKNHKTTFIESAQWFDVGHNDNYIKARTKVAARSFNSIKIDDKRGILTKTSSNKDKLVDEIRWYLRIPGKLQYLSPRIYEYSLDVDDPYVSMEYYGYHTLHESLIYGNLSEDRWRSIFEKLLFMVNDMATFKVMGREDQLLQSVRSIYLDKTISRMTAMRKEEKFKNFFTDKITINGRLYPSLNTIIADLPQYIECKLCKDLTRYFNVIHGDLCFTNILLEDDLNFMRIIDPRGRFGVFDVYGDRRYEIAKLFHSMEGKYDYIIEDMFDVTVNDNDINIKIYDNGNYVFNVFMDVFREHIADINSVRLIEATLFLSMIPLHGDYPMRQYAMLAIGVILYEKFKEGICDDKI